MKKLLIIFLTAMSIAFGCLALSSCKPTPPSGSNENTQIMAIYDLYVNNAEAKGETPLSYEDWLAQIKGEKGEDGLSSYEIWLQNGNEGTEADFLNWLKGDKGDKGDQGESGDKGDQGEQGIQGDKGDKGDQGEQGIQGEDGKSAYQIWLENGNEGTEADFLSWLKGLNDHNFGEWIAFSPIDVDCSEKLYYRACSDCSKVDWKQGSFDDHDWSEEYLSDGEYHWRKCTLCGATNERGTHIEGPYGNCTVCNPILPTDGVIYQGHGTFASVIGYEGSSSEVVIADSYNGMPVTNIGWLALGEKESITKVIIPNTVTTIEGRAFNKSTNLTSVVIPDSVITIGEWAFCDCQSLKSINIPDSVTSIGEGAFFCCYQLKDVHIEDLAAWCNISFGVDVNIFDKAENLYVSNVLTTDLTLPDSITSIPDYLFDGCLILNSIIIPDSVTAIGNSAFSECRNLSSVIIGNKVVSIGDYAFSLCNNLTTVHFGSSVTSIGHSAFNFTSLKSVTLPDSIITIEEYAFNFCENLISVVIPDSITTISNAAFRGCTRLKDVYYKGSAENWANISIDNSEDNNSYIINATRYYYIEKQEGVPTDGGNYWHYDENGEIAVW